MKIDTDVNLWEDDCCTQYRLTITVEAQKWNDKTIMTEVVNDDKLKKLFKEYNKEVRK